MYIIQMVKQIMIVANDEDGGGLALGLMAQDWRCLCTKSAGEGRVEHPHLLHALKHQETCGPVLFPIMFDSAAGQAGNPQILNCSRFQLWRT